MNAHCTHCIRAVRVCVLLLTGAHDQRSEREHGNRNLNSASHFCARRPPLGLRDAPTASSLNAGRASRQFGLLVPSGYFQEATKTISFCKCAKTKFHAKAGFGLFLPLDWPLISITIRNNSISTGRPIVAANMRRLEAPSLDCA